MNFETFPVTASIAERAAELRAQFRLRTPDALQLATVIEAGGQAFLTNDSGLRRVTVLPVIVLDELEL
jgi:predicted nucleic acid-binding protein